MFEKEIKEIVEKAGYDYNVSVVIVNLLKYMQTNHWIGACYATSSVLYVCLKEIGYNPKLCIGEVKSNLVPLFDHGWVELDGKIIDLACYMTLLDGRPISKPIILDTEIGNENRYTTIYGVVGLGLSNEAKSIIEMPFEKYMSRYKQEVGGLFGVANIVLNRKGSIRHIREKYKGNPWNYIKTGEKQ